MNNILSTITLCYISKLKTLFLSTAYHSGITVKINSVVVSSLNPLRRISLLFFAHFLLSSSAQSSTLTADINPTGSSLPSYLTVFNDKLYFQANDGSNGAELWVYDGTNEPIMVANINLSGSSSPKYLTVFNNKLYFQANDGFNGTELWAYDGTNEPIMVANINPSGSSSPGDLKVYNGKLYFTANDGTYGYELWSYYWLKSLGWISSRKTNINPSGHSNPRELTVFNNQLYFRATDGTNGVELWSYDGVNAPLMETDISQEGGSSNPNSLTVFNNKLCFSAKDDSTYGSELWQHNGVYAHRIDINPTGDSLPSELRVYNDKLFFQASGDSYGLELWEYDGVNAPERVSDLNPGFQDSFPSSLTVFNDKLYFSANDGSNGTELWVYDSVSSPVRLDINPGIESSIPRNLTVFNNKLYFSAYDGSSKGTELWEHTQHKITASAAGNGNISPSGIVWVEDGLSQQFVITPEEYYYIVDVVIDNNNSLGQQTTHTFEDVKVGHTIEATFAPNVLTVTKAGTGTGTVSTLPLYEISCPESCSQDHSPFLYNQSVELHASTDLDNNTFTGWSSGDPGFNCPGTSSCTVTMNQAREITATFTRNSHNLTLIKNGRGEGTVTSDLGGIVCDNSCEDTVQVTIDNDEDVTLSVSNMPSWSLFTGWSVTCFTEGCIKSCSSTGPCTVSMNDHVEVTANFDIDTVSVANSKAIIVAGYGEDSSNWMWDQTTFNAHYAYSVLRAQDYLEANIRYLSSEPDDEVNLDEDPDSERYGDATWENLKESITSTWARDAESLVIYLVGHGDRKTFVINHTDHSHRLLYAYELDDWLNDLQYDNPTLRDVYVIYDGCFSGSFIPFLKSGYKRYILTSTTADNQASFDLGGRLSFSYQFWSVVYEGAVVSEAFNYANDMIPEQPAWFDTNSNGTPNEDGYDSLVGLLIGAGIQRAAATRPIITSVAPNHVVQNKNDPVLLWADIDYSDNVTAWALLIPPDYNPSAPDTPADKFTVVPLDYSGGNRYETMYNGFDKGGTYKIWYYAENDHGELSEPLSSPSTVKVLSFPWIFLPAILQAGQVH